MTLFYYPASIEEAVAVADRGQILCPHKFELHRLRIVKETDPDRYFGYCVSYGSKDATDDDIAFRVASSRHLVDIRTKERVTIPESEWLKSVRVYGQWNDALKHLVGPRCGAILGIELMHQPTAVLFANDVIDLQGQLREVHIYAQRPYVKLVAKPFVKYKVPLHRIKKVNHAKNA